jgi:hypothetical protein
MRKALAVILIGGSLAAGVSTALAMEKESPYGTAQPVTTAIVTPIASSDSVGTVAGPSSVWVTHEHDNR